MGALRADVRAAAHGDHRQPVKDLRDGAVALARWCLHAHPPLSNRAPRRLRPIVPARCRKTRVVNASPARRRRPRGGTEFQAKCLCSGMFLPGRLALCFLALWVALAAPIPAHATAGTPQPVAGFVDLRGRDFAHRGTVELDGAWLLHPGAFDDPTAAPAGRPVPVPGPWNPFMPDGIAEGFGTYAVTIACDSASGLGLSFPVEHSAVHWYVNGRLVSQQGDPGASADAAHPAAVQRIVQLVDVRCPVHLVAHVSNFEARRGGLMRSIELGDMRE